MKIQLASSIDLFVENSTTYATIKVEVKSTIWAVTKATGKYNYVNVRKATNNPFGGLGKHFEDFDAAVTNYKDEGVKAALHLAQSEFAKCAESNKINI